jgi:ribonuclease HII
MARALAQLNPAPDYALVDGLPVRGLPVPHRAIVGGDAACWSIAAASVVAKVTRDRLMATLGTEYPAYGFERHKGYGTAAHLAALQRHGPCPIHRRSFAPVAQRTWKW